MSTDPFKLEILSGVKEEVITGEVSWDRVRELDRQGVRVVGEPPPDAWPGVPPYAFLIGRLERDFAQAREAMRVAVESEAGIDFLWVDDGRHRTNVGSIRERTRLLVKHATFLIADLTLGVESPERENPSRAHEIGLALAYERKVMISSQEPRRDPYYSIGDMQMTFWGDEAELERQVRAWVRLHRESVARRVYNYELPDPVIRKPSFTYDPARRYVGPNTVRLLSAQ